MAAPQKPVVLITGATGLLGRAIVAAFEKTSAWRVVGTAFSRADAAGLVKHDLRDHAATAALVASLKPAYVVHAAAERRPDVVDKNVGESEVLNVDAVWALAHASRVAGAGMLYVSTDYLWDGTKAPYAEDGPVCPPNNYGRLKLRGEYAALAAHGGATVLRVPVLFGPTADLAESAVTMFAAIALNAAKPAKVDDWQIRVPTYTPDIGATIANFAGAHAGGRALPGIFNYSSTDRFTRWGLTVAFAKLLGVPVDHVDHDANPPPGAPRPYDCQLVTSKIEAAGVAAPVTPFDVAARAILDGLGLLPKA